MEPLSFAAGGVCIGYGGSFSVRQCARPGNRRCRPPMLQKTCQPIDGYGSGARSSASERFLLACAPDSQEHTPHPIDAGQVADSVCKAKLADGQLVACHLHQRRAIVFLVGPTTLLFCSPAPMVEQRGLREIRYAMLQPVPSSARRESG
jgi:hypothetical protein